MNPRPDLPHGFQLLQVLSRLDARLVDPAGPELAPERATLSGTGQSLIRTRLGRIDALGALHDGRGYGQLLARQRAKSE
ncbi:MAG TPA: hypothetical protein VNQ32_07750 [Steroidobacteraceae bacterium]|nr:hypothetical protein [Steroidobacteraceae bacterium]